MQQAGITGTLATALTQLASTASGYAAGGTAGGASAFNEVTNNYLKHDEVEKHWKAVDACSKGDKTACGERDTLKAKSDSRDAKLQSCEGSYIPSCNAAREEVRQAEADIIRNLPGIVDDLTLGTQNQADKTLLLKPGMATADAIGSVIKGAVTDIVTMLDGALTGLVVAMAPNGTELKNKALNDLYQSEVQTGKALQTLSDPELITLALQLSKDSDRERIAKAYEHGSAFEMGQVLGDVLSAYTSVTAPEVAVLKLSAGTLAKLQKASEAAKVLSTSGGMADAGSFELDRLLTDAAKLGKVSTTGNFANEASLLGHFEKHGKEFDVTNSNDYLQTGREIIQNGQKIVYNYKGEVRTGYVKFMGNTSNGNAKFGFVGTNSDGAITTIHTQSGNSFWKLLNGNSNDKVIRQE